MPCLQFSTSTSTEIQAHSGRLSSDPTAAAGTDCLAAWTDAVSSSVVMLLSFCYAQLARFWFIFLPLFPFRVCVCVRQQPQNHFTSLSFNKLYNIFNLKRNKINLLTIVEQSSASSGTPLSLTNPSPSLLLSCDYCFHLTLGTLASFM